MTVPSGGQRLVPLLIRRKVYFFCLKDLYIALHVWERCSIPYEELHFNLLNYIL